MNFAVIGAGAWGTAFAVHLSRLGHTVTLVPRRFEQALDLASGRENADYLPGVELPPSLQIGHELGPVLLEAEIVLLACPAQALRGTTARLLAASADARGLQLVLSLAKGLERDTHLRPSQVLADVLGETRVVGCLTGPTNAGEVARGLPAGMVLAGNRDDAILPEVQAAVSGPTLRVYLSDDLTGVELGGCFKNVYAIAAGCCDGLGLGDNTKAAMLTRALAEMVRVGAALGARPETFYGLGGFGDLVATCHGEWSRNRQFGEAIGRGRDVAALLRDRRTVVEGYKTAESLHGLCRERSLDAPLLAAVYGILYESLAPAEALRALMTRELKRE
jgi:glycerol-3-phosphate dehydrogenase (NAD(P)+)